MLKHILKTYFRIFVTTWKQFGFKKPFFRLGIMTGLWLAFTHFFMWLDNIFLWTPQN